MSNAHASAHPAGDASHGSQKSYTIGFVLSLVLTVLSFGTVMSGFVPQSAMLTGIVVFAVAQLLVQLVFFLHMGTSPDQRNNLAIFLFTGLIIAIVVSGSLWVMHNADVNMMPTSMSADRAMSRD
jgi:cytochrome o ubiquinol oxidase operon protein cyoD